MSPATAAPPNLAMKWGALLGAWAMLGAAVLSGCEPKKLCERDDDCGVAQVCDPVAYTCLQGKEDSSCTPGCPEGKYCRERLCYDRYAAIDLLEPTGGLVPGGAPVRAQLRTVATWIEPGPEPKLSYSASGTTTLTGDLLRTGDAGLYAGQLLLPSGNYRLYVGFPGFPDGGIESQRVDITVDSAPPSFTVKPETKTGLRNGTGSLPNDQDVLLTDAFKRDDVVRVDIQSDASDLELTSFTFQVLGVDAGTPMTVAATLATSCAVAHCWTASVDLGLLEMWALRGQVSLTAQGRDLAGNVGQGSAQVPVTRVKWSRQMSTGAVSASPAIGTSGTIYVATRQITTGALMAIKPDGTNQWASAFPFNSPIMASPAVGKGNGVGEVVYVIGKATPATFYSFYGSNGLDAGTANGNPGMAEASPLVAATTNGLNVTSESATTFLNGGGTSLYTIRISDGSAVIGGSSAGAVAFPGNVVGGNNQAFAGDSLGRVREYAIDMGSWSERPAIGTILPASPKGLLLTSATVAGATSGSVFAFPRSGGTPLTWAATNPSIPILVGGDLVYSAGVATSTSAIRTSPAGVPLANAALSNTTTSALVARGQVVYFVDNDRKLDALTANLTPLWSGVVMDGGSGVASSPNIDCGRDSSGALRPGAGTLYFGDEDGYLNAIIVDNPGIDTTSTWPKYQHDPRNTGSLATPLSEFVCP